MWWLIPQLKPSAALRHIVDGEIAEYKVKLRKQIISELCEKLNTLEY